MYAIIRNELKQTRKVLCVWIGIMLLLCAFAYFELLSFQDSLEELAGMINRFPRLVVIMFGIRSVWKDQMDLFCCLYFWFGLVGFAYAVYLGVTCMGRECKNGTLEYLFSKPVSREKVVLAKTAASGINLLVFSVFGGVCCYLFGINLLHLFSGAAPIVLIAIGMFLTQMLLFSGALFVAALGSSYRATVRRSAVMLLLFYAVYFAVEYTENFALRYLTPLEYFNVYDVAEEGISLAPLFLTVILVLLCTGVSMVRWGKGRKDVYY